MRLLEIQEGFREALLRPRSMIGAIDAAFLQLFSQDGIPIDERLSIYHNNVIGSVSRALASDFPLLEKLVGEAFLMDLCRRYVIAHPPQTGCLYDYGDGFADFVKAQDLDFPYLFDVARLEHALKKASNAADDAPLDPASLLNRPQDDLADMNLTLRASCSLIRSDYPLMAIRDFCLNPDSPPPDLSQQSGATLLVFRPDLEAVVLPLEPSEYYFLENIAQNKTLGEAYAETISGHPDFNIMTILQKHLLLRTFKSL